MGIALKKIAKNKKLRESQETAKEIRCYSWLQNRGYISRELLNSIDEEDLSSIRSFLNDFFENLKENEQKHHMPPRDIYVLKFIWEDNIWFEDVENAIGVNPESLVLLKKEFCKQYSVACLDYSREEVIVAVSAPWDYNLLDQISRHISSENYFFVGAPEKTIQTILKHHWLRTAEESEGREFIKIRENSSTTNRTTENDSHIIMDEILQKGITEGASDIHIEPLRESGGFSVKMRVDGRIYDYPELSSPSEAIDPLVARVKILGGMLVQETRMPQDGGFPRGSGKFAVDCRVATLPSVLGHGKEKVVIRLLRPAMDQTLEDLGFSHEEFNFFKEVISCPNGIILVTGPTGSGKSTTLHCALHEFVKKKEFSIYTVEDPVEYRLPGAHQLQVQRNVVEFPEAFRSFLRADPDIIMVGELRDAETVHVALQAAITGHLVFSTLHTNDAPSVVPRLLAMSDDKFIVEPYLVAAALRGALAQRLLERICPECKIERELLPEECSFLNVPPGTRIFDINPTGCNACKHRGVSGRTAIFEIVNFQQVPRWEELVNTHSKVSHEEIRKSCLEGGMTSLFESGKNKLLNGVVSSRSFYNTFGKLKLREKVEEKRGITHHQH